MPLLFSPEAPTVGVSFASSPQRLPLVRYAVIRLLLPSIPHWNGAGGQEVARKTMKTWGKLGLYGVSMGKTASKILELLP